MKKVTAVLLVTIALVCVNTVTIAQPPAGKYNTTDYPEDRKAIELIKRLPDSLQHLNDDYIAVGPEGKIS